MSRDKKHVFRAMVEESKRILEEEPPETTDGRYSPPLIRVTPETDRFRESSHQSILWIGLTTAKAPHFNDEAIKSALEDFGTERDGIEVTNPVKSETDIRVDEDVASVGTVVDLTETLLEEVYEMSFNDNVSLEWEDIANRERLDANEFASERV